MSIGVAFYLWLGIFNLMALAQFWAFANDLYNEEQGKRLFPVVGIGSSLGALAGAQIASRYFADLGVNQLLLTMAFTTRHFALANVVFIVLWLGVTFMLLRNGTMPAPAMAPRR